MEEEINVIAKKIEKLEKRKKEYNNMKTSLENAIEDFDESVYHIGNAYEKLEENYSSDVSKEKLAEIEAECGNVKDIRTLCQKMVNESNTRIEEINKEIEIYRGQIEDLKLELEKQE